MVLSADQGQIDSLQSYGNKTGRLEWKSGRLSRTCGMEVWKWVLEFFSFFVGLLNILVFSLK
jgi:hypothetical protein